ncbi:hypothetical protein [Paenibacillus chitinolyticus]|uniref:hypothetical protein n=1 Tax=Paenibacillus chitinolyticus TaxID=79263 RepID=UPI001C451A5A|nr:hypothetical protein [Paenibacillus chitinolyticus]MBV6716024.1 hypothetical protein [Paenibacillus chitinolyticus]
MTNITEINSLENWQNASRERREDICNSIINKLPGRFKLVKPHIIKNPQNGEEIEIPCFYDELYETPLNLIFGGDFIYGASSQHIESIRNIGTPNDWSMISQLIHQSEDNENTRINPFLMSRFPVYEWVLEENINLSNDEERPDFYSEDGPFPAYVNLQEAKSFLEKTGYRMPWDFEWEYVSKEFKNNLFICGEEIPSRDLSDDICLTQFGDSRLNKAASNNFGIAGLAIAAFTRIGGASDEIIVRGGAAGFYPFQHPSQWAMLLTELQLPLKNMPGQLAGLRLCLDIPEI